MQILGTPQRAQHPNEQPPNGRRQDRQQAENAISKQIRVTQARIVPRHAVALAPQTQHQRRHDRHDLTQHNRQHEETKADFGRRGEVLVVDLSLDTALFAVLLCQPGAGRFANGWKGCHDCFGKARAPDDLFGCRVNLIDEERRCLAVARGWRTDTTPACTCRGLCATRCTRRRSICSVILTVIPR